MLSIAEFCDLHDACHEGREWALAECKTMEDVWDRAKPVWLIWVATRPGVLDDRTLRLLAVSCARSVEHLLTDQRSRDAISVADRFANGHVTAEELSAARSALSAADAAALSALSAADAARSAFSAARSAARSAALSAADAARSAADAAARSAARSAFSAARSAADAAALSAFSAARSAAWSAADAARSAFSAARSSQAEWLKKNAKPNFDRSVVDE